MKERVLNKWLGALIGCICMYMLIGLNTLEVRADEGGCSYVANGMHAVGVEQYIDGHWYLQDQQTGNYVRGFVYLEDAGKMVYYNPADGQMLYGEQCVDGHWYFLNPHTGAVSYGFQYIENADKWVFYDRETGWMQYGEQCIDGHWYLLNSYTGAVTYGFQYIEKDNKWVFYDRVMGWMLYGEQCIDNGWYYLDPMTGAVSYQWTWLPNSEKWVYYDAFSGRMCHEWHNVGGKMHYFDKYTGELRFASNEMYDAWLMAQNMGSQTEYLMMINNSACRLFIFQGSKGNWTPLFDWACSPGKDSTPTVRGNYKVAARGLHFGEDKGYTCYYWTQFYGDYLFHSILYYPGSMNPMEPWLGQRLSHGCVRLSIENARWIYDRIPRGTKVYS